MASNRSPRSTSRADAADLPMKLTIPDSRRLCHGDGDVCDSDDDNDTEALYTTDARVRPRGHTNRFGEDRYHLSFYSMPDRTAIGRFFQILYLLGAGNNFVVLLPNDISWKATSAGATSRPQGALPPSSLEFCLVSLPNPSLFQ